MIPFLAIPGTHGWNGSSAGQWYDPGSPWSANMRAKGFEHLHLLGEDRRPFVWSTDLNGQQFWRRWFGKKPSSNDWQAAGCNLYAYLVPPRAPQHRLPAAETHIVAHSHALQCVAFAASDGLKINTLITVGSPVRVDLFEVFKRARPNIGFWWHFYSDASDRWQWLGAIGDGAIGVTRKHPFADQNVGLPGVGHAGILNDPRVFADVWGGPLDLIRSRHGH